MVGKTIFGAPLKLVLTVITQSRVTAMPIVPTQRQMTNMHMKALKYIGHMKKNQKLFAIKNVSVHTHGHKFLLKTKKTIKIERLSSI